tara:strand:- start:19 stop:342 length:324 start_codon:yes stop_codon:yes gene_type:complete
MVEQNNTEIRSDEERVSGGSKEGVVRWVLGFGLLLAIVALSVIWIVPALTDTGEEDVSSRVVSPQEAVQAEGDEADVLVPPEEPGNEDAAVEASEPDTAMPVDQAEN